MWLPVRDSVHWRRVGAGLGLHSSERWLICDTVWLVASKVAIPLILMLRAATLLASGILVERADHHVATAR